MLTYLCQYGSKVKAEKHSIKLGVSNFCTKDKPLNTKYIVMKH